MSYLIYIKNITLFTFAFKVMKNHIREGKLLFAIVNAVFILIWEALF